MQEIQLHPGLKDVYLDKTESSFIDGGVGKLLYRGYNIHDLAEKSTFEETVFLLLHGKLPTRSELDAFDAQLRAGRAIPPQVIKVIEMTQKSHPMDVLRTGVSALAAYDPDTEDKSVESTLRKGVRLTAQAATIVAAHERIRKGLQPVPPSPDLGHAANFLYMMFGKKPDPEEAKILDVDFILHAEHGSNASSFAARQAASTLSDLHSAVVGGIGVLKGPWHGGAAEAVMDLVHHIETPEKAEAYVKSLTSRGEKIMGFGHRVYKAEDPRAQHLRERSRKLGEKKGQPQWYKLLQHLEQQVMAPYRAKGIFVNVDFYAGSIYYLLGIPEDIFISIFAMGRVPGWALQVMEQYKDNILIRPLLQYVGPMDVEYVPIEKRGAPAPPVGAER